MKKLLALFLVILTIFSLTACAGGNSAGTDGAESGNPSTSARNSAQSGGQGKKILVAYFSATGTTKNVAEQAADAMEADIYEITPAQPYTSDDLNYNDKNSRSTKEMNDPDSRPKISGGVENMADYDIIFIGYPIWWGEAPRIVSTFVQSYDFSGKTVVTFSTSGSSPHNDSSIKSLASDANWIDGKRFSGNASSSDVADWINGLGLGITAD